jgi:hypothetical protein
MTTKRKGGETHVVRWEVPNLLELADEDVLTSAGKVIGELAVEHARIECGLVRKQQALSPSLGERDFEAAVDQTTQHRETLKKVKGRPQAREGNP